MEDSKFLTIISKDQKSMQIDIRFQNISGLIKNVLMDNTSFEPIPVPIPSEILEIIFLYAKQHNFDPPNLTIPICSDNVKLNLASAKDYELLKQFDKFTIKPLLKAAIQLDIPSLIDNCICLIASDFYFEPTEQGLQKLKIKHEIFEGTNKDMENYIQNEFPWAFGEFEFLSSTKETKEEKQKVQN